MIEIRELVIRATVEENPRRNGERNGKEVNTESNGQKKNCTETIDMLLQIINDKKER